MFSRDVRGGHIGTRRPCAAAEMTAWVLGSKGLVVELRKVGIECIHDDDTRPFSTNTFKSFVHQRTSTLSSSDLIHL